ncbi:MAG: Fic family protein [Opitutales bacterium]
MPSPSENLAKSLDALRDLQKQGHGLAIRSKDLSRTNRERLLNSGFIREVMKGWYFPVNPHEKTGESTSWYAAFWPFCAAYLRERFGEDWCLSPEQSLSLHAGNTTVPSQLLVRTPKGFHNTVRLPHGTSIFDLKAQLPSSDQIEQKDNLNIFSVETALIHASPGFYKQNALDVRAVLSIIKDGSKLLEKLLEGGHSRIAGRLAGAFRSVGKDRIADDILKTMRSVGYTVNEEKPFEIDLIVPKREFSPHANRISIMWEEMRTQIIEHFPEAPGLPKSKKAYLESLADIYAADAYNSLSIEGYRVTPELIERVRSGQWNPDQMEADRAQRDALAARGYWQAFQEVKRGVEQILDGDQPGKVADENHGDWYRELFAPSVTAGILKASDLAGYRSTPVYIRQSMHVPMNTEAVRDAMPRFFELLSAEDNPAVRVVLGHFIFVYIHPYPDGNGRIGRFLMNTMLAAGGYPWLVVPVEKRDAYMAALESASVQNDIIPFTQFLAGCMEE